MKGDDMTAHKGIALLAETELFRGLGADKIATLLTICA